MVSQRAAESLEKKGAELTKELLSPAPASTLPAAEFTLSGVVS
jgi:hypothetical protein